MSKILPFLTFLIGAVIVAFGAGIAVNEFKLPPYPTIASGAKTLLYTYKGLNAPPYLGQFVGPAPDVPPAEAAANRFEAIDPAAAGLPETLLITGGLNEFLEHCPEDGCLAVEVDRAGTVTHAIPYRPDEIFAADITDGSFYREGVPPDPRLIKRPIGLKPYANGDYLVSFQTTGNMFPFSGGLARIDRDGHPLWYRFDYSHHWVNVMPDGRIIIPDLVLEEGDWEVGIGTRGRIYDQYCETGRPQVDGIHILDGDGAVLQRIDVDKALRESRWAPLMSQTPVPCDPLHINYVDVLDYTAPGGVLEPGNLVVSLRNLSMVAIMDPDTGAVLDVVRGSFMQQHAVQQLRGSKALVFDNWGGAGNGHGSRLLEIDLAGGPERQIFPDPDALQTGRPLFSFRAGHLSISPETDRALVSFTEDSVGVEVDLASGAPVMTWTSLHDLSGLEQATEAQKSAATRAKLFGMYYLQP
ncbi:MULTISPECIES: arylsulfotransferase family protein [unclassified Meridianimarinicoccus]|uniref:arylsulfotransferase family protein n=1 Tax=unclassified Meridianimarinicoccus TaxID=2923344 RepID=UPI001867DC81|nr:arylsulfotransferase family protein [Fluviibacterium sp. MJW13]